MEPVYVDVHIHTSENPDSLNQNYDIDTLFEKVRAQAQGQHGLISLTDHNTCLLYTSPSPRDRG